MTTYTIEEVEVGEDVQINERDIIIGVSEKSGTLYLVLLRIKAGVR